jgi:hypothetical protein
LLIVIAALEPSLSSVVTINAELTLNCWVDGGDRGRVFLIKISSSETVSTLKDAIKDKKKPTFDHVPADSLDLWKVSDVSPLIGIRPLSPITRYPSRSPQISRRKSTSSA